MTTRRSVRNVQIDATNIEDQSYFNLCRISDLTGYANPVAAILGSTARWVFSVDTGGNICTLICNSGGPNRIPDIRSAGETERRYSYHAAPGLLPVNLRTSV